MNKLWGTGVGLVCVLATHWLHRSQAASKPKASSSSDSKSPTREEFPQFFEQLDANFPGAMPLTEALGKSSAILNAKGFTKASAIAMVSQCRDEMTVPVFDCLNELWGETFNMSSLAGMVFCGKTGFGAAMHHSPQAANGDERYVVFAGPHIGISADGTIGSVTRPGRPNPSGACGALMAFHNQMEQNVLDFRMDLADVEQSMMRQHLVQKLQLHTQGTPNLVALTKVAHDTILDSVREFMNASFFQHKRHHHAICTGILIHGPNGSNFFWMGHLSASNSSGSLLP